MQSCRNILKYLFSGTVKEREEKNEEGKKTRNYKYQKAVATGFWESGVKENTRGGVLAGKRDDAREIEKDKQGKERGM